MDKKTIPVVKPCTHIFPFAIKRILSGIFFNCTITAWEKPCFFRYSEIVTPLSCAVILYSKSRVINNSFPENHKTIIAKNDEKIKEEKHGELAPNIRCIKKAFKVRFENIFISVDDGTGKRMSEENEKW